MVFCSSVQFEICGYFTTIFRNFALKE